MVMIIINRKEVIQKNGKMVKMIMMSGREEPFLFRLNCNDDDDDVDDDLILSQTINFRLFQTERPCRRKFQV